MERRQKLKIFHRQHREQVLRLLVHGDPIQPDLPARAIVEPVRHFFRADGHMIPGVVIRCGHNAFPRAVFFIDRVRPGERVTLHRRAVRTVLRRVRHGEKRVFRFFALRAHHDILDDRCNVCFSELELRLFLHKMRADLNFVANLHRWKIRRGFVLIEHIRHAHGRLAVVHRKRRELQNVHLVAVAVTTVRVVQLRHHGEIIRAVSRRDFILSIVKIQNVRRQNFFKRLHRVGVQVVGARVRDRHGRFTYRLLRHGADRLKFALRRIDARVRPDQQSRAEHEQNRARGEQQQEQEGFYRRAKELFEAL